MFPNLNAEMARFKITAKDMAIAVDMKYDTLLNKLKGKTEFTRPEMYLIKNTFFPSQTIDFLFLKCEAKSA